MVGQSIDHPAANVIGAASLLAGVGHAGYKGYKTAKKLGYGGLGRVGGFAIGPFTGLFKPKHLDEKLKEK